MVKRLLVLSTLLLFAASARAGVVVALDNVSNVSGHFNWVYNVTLENNSQMSAEDYFVLYDIPGLITPPVWSPNVGTPPNLTGVPDITHWTVAETGTGPVPPNLLPKDGSDPNAVVSLNPGEPLIAPRPQDTSGLLLGQLTVSSPFDTEGLINFTSQSAQSGGSPLYVIKLVAGPIPEPSTVGMMGAGLMAFVAVALRRRRPPR